MGLFLKCEVKNEYQPKMLMLTSFLELPHYITDSLPCSVTNITDFREEKGCNQFEAQKKGYDSQG